VGLLLDFLRGIANSIHRPAFGYEVSFTLGAIIVLISGLLVHFVQLKKPGEVSQDPLLVDEVEDKLVESQDIGTE
jgi:hypothetical protein